MDGSVLALLAAYQNNLAIRKDLLGKNGQNLPLIGGNSY